jgi:hypothetical protein
MEFMKVKIRVIYFFGDELSRSENRQGVQDDWVSASSPALLQRRRVPFKPRALKMLHRSLLITLSHNSKRQYSSSEIRRFYTHFKNLKCFPHSFRITCCISQTSFEKISYKYIDSVSA